MLKRLVEFVLANISRINMIQSNSLPQINPSDFENSPLRFEYEAILEEYRMVWSEIHSREAHIQQTTNFALIVAGGFIALVETTKGNLSFTETLMSLRSILPLLSIVFSGFFFMQVHHSVMMAHLGNYSDTNLRPRMKQIILLATKNSADIWKWNQFKSLKRSENLIAPIRLLLGSANFLITVGASIGLTVMSFLFLQSGSSATLGELIAISIAAFLSICVIIALIQHGIVYRKIAKE